MKIPEHSFSANVTAGGGLKSRVIQSAESWRFLQSTLLGLLLFNFAIITLTADRGISRWEFIL